MDNDLILIDPSATQLPREIIELNKSIRSGNFGNDHAPAESDLGPRILGPQDHALSDENEEFIHRSGNNYRLERWDVRLHSYSEEKAGEVDFFAGLFGGKVKQVKAGVIHEAKRFTLIETEGVSNGYVEVGVAVRLSAASTSFSSDLEVSLFNLAADAQLSKDDARVGISVIGYSGGLEYLLPSPKSLDVETCIEYLESFKKIQEKVFSDENSSSILPTTIAYRT